tara:strand:+ start:637 stop:768 length:132 start_codon:yes stop_codon:yes gene_type:complete
LKTSIWKTLKKPTASEEGEEEQEGNNGEEDSNDGMEDEQTFQV